MLLHEMEQHLNLDGYIYYENTYWVTSALRKQPLIMKVQDKTLNTLQRKTSSSKSDVWTSLPIKVQTFGFQDQEAWTLVENE